MHPHPFIKKLWTKAKSHKATIVLAEAQDSRVIEAARILEQKKLCEVILLGEEKKIRTLIKKSLYPLKATIIDPSDVATDFAQQLVALRKGKMTLAQAKKFVQNPNYFAAFLVRTGVADGFVGGNMSKSDITFLAGIHVLQALPKMKAFSYFIMLNPKEKNPLFFADCGFNVQPDETLLAEIAYGTAKEAKFFGINPKVAMLSYSTQGSGKGAPADMVRKAVLLAKRKKVLVDELQFDAAIVPEIGKHKAPKSSVAGKANVFVFPDLHSGNIAYKIAERLGGWHAIGPIVWGLKYPMADLSRGCSVEDIVAASAVLIIHAKR